MRIVCITFEVARRTGARGPGFESRSRFVLMQHCQSSSRLHRSIITNTILKTYLVSALQWNSTTWVTIHSNSVLQTQMALPALQREKKHSNCFHLLSLEATGYEQKVKIRTILTKYRASKLVKARFNKISRSLILQVRIITRSGMTCYSSAE